MKSNGTYKIWAVALIFVSLGPSTALGSHLDFTSTPPDSHKSQHSQKPQNTASLEHTLPGAPAPSIPPPQTSAPKQSFPVTTTPEQKTQKVKPYTKYAWRLVLKGKYKAAVNAYHQAIKKNPNAAPSYVGLGIALTNAGNIETAKKAFLKAIDLDSQLSSALVHLGYIYAQGALGQAEPKTALRLFRQASQLGDPFADIALLDMKSRSKL